jgi:hypothetical protein
MSVTAIITDELFHLVVRQQKLRCGRTSIEFISTWPNARSGPQPHRLLQLNLTKQQRFELAASLLEGAN